MTRKVFMADSPVHVPDAASRFFSNYLSCLDKASVPEKQRRWYVKRVEAFINAQNGRRIKHLTRMAIALCFIATGELYR